jgi:hypothetical protein
VWKTGFLFLQIITQQTWLTTILLNLDGSVKHLIAPDNA